MGYLRFLRLPGVFTAFADIIAGFFILRFAGISSDHLGYLPQLLAASGCFYLAGMAWNDLFDVEEDRRLRPERPLPAGEISLTGGYVTAIVLMTAGLMLAMTAGYAAFFIAATLVTVIFLYDGLLKDFPIIGPLCMGGCRGLNVLLGMSAHATLLWSWRESTVWVPPLLATLYVTAITVLASWENDGEAQSFLSSAADSTPPTDFDSSLLSSTPPADPREGVLQNDLRRRHDLEIMLRQNRLDANAPAIVRPDSEYTPPPGGVRPALIAVFTVPLLLGIILPHWTAFLPIVMWLGLLIRPAANAWGGGVAELRHAVGTALSGICLFDAALLAGFCPHFFSSREEPLACAVVAAMTVPVFILRKYIT